MKKLIQKYDSRRYTLIEYLPVIFMFIFLIWLMVYSIVKKGNYREVYLSSEFEEKVLDIYEEKGDTYLLLTNKNRRIKVENSRNYNYEPSYLYGFLKENDIVIKHRCSDTLYVERESKIYYFLIGSGFHNSKVKSKKFIQRTLDERRIMNERNNCN